jgi:hypothetical protein
VSEDADAFVAAFKTINYKMCENGLPENGFTKIALFVRNGRVRHAARQLDAVLWTSKFGCQSPVAIHRLRDVCGYYGQTTVFMRRPTNYVTKQIDARRVAVEVAKPMNVSTIGGLSFAEASRQIKRSSFEPPKPKRGYCFA